MLKVFWELLTFLLARKKYWLLPIMLVLALLGGLVVLGKGSAVAPFIYTIF
ncbi:MAG TPA: DUF5989 family protein [Rhodocyclaceae bacterium]|nr:DUF5989 family protein [Rhodocyclaceae bacterium]